MTTREVGFNIRWNHKPQVAIHCESDGSGNKTRAMRLCTALHGRWSDREQAYIMTPAKAKKFLALWDAGRDAHLGDANGMLGYVL